MAKQNRVCLASGYKYEYAPASKRGNWRTDSDSQWDIVTHKAVCGQFVGHRRVNGTRVTVVRAGGKLYASKHATRGLPPNKVKKGSRFV